MRGLLLFLCFACVLLPQRLPAQTYLPEFDTAAEAQQYCPYDTVIWINAQDVLPHYQGQHLNNPAGGYTCKQAAINAGYGRLVNPLQPVQRLR